MRFLLLSLLLSVLFCTAKGQQLIINEFSQGANGAQEYIELVVVGQKNCAGDSCADIRGWIIDDNNGWYGASGGQGIAPGHMRFSNDANWSCVPFGSIILLYNLGDKNPVITLPDDPTDANNDNVYVLPSVSPLIEGNTATPLSPSSLTYVYPATAYTASPAWNCIGLANTGDAVIVVNPANPGAAEHSIAYGNLTSAASAFITKTTSGGAKNYYLTNDQYTSSAAYNVGNAPADETPGVPNTAANAAWINSMLTSIVGTADYDVYACIEQGSSYNFNGSVLTASGIYTDTFNTSLGCDSIIHMHLDVVTPVLINGFIQSCQPVVFNGITYTASAIANDTLFTTLGCDSAYLTMTIQIELINTTEVRDTVSGCQSVVYKGIPYTTSQEITDTIKTAQGCDSIYKKVYLNVLPTPQVNVPDNITLCKGASATLTANAAYPVTWDGFPQGATITVSPDETTRYIARVVNELNCEGIAGVTVFVERFALSLTAAVTEAEIGVPLALNVTGTQDFNVTGWQPATLFPDQHAKQQQVTFHEEGIVYITVTGETDDNCSDTATLPIKVLRAPSVFIPDAFSPNGDGMNDFFRPVFIRDYAIRNFSIYNRWGQKVYGVYTRQQLGDGWNGTFNGARCEQGTYYYILSIQDPLERASVIKGDVTLVQ